MLHRCHLLIPCLIVPALWAWSLSLAYEAGEDRLLMRIRHLPDEQRRWNNEATNHRHHAEAAERCLHRLDRLYDEEGRLWDRYERLNRSVEKIITTNTPQS